MRKPWKRVTINFSEEDYKNLRFLAGMKQMSNAGFLKYLIDLYLQTNKSVADLIKELDEDFKTAKPS